MSDDTTQICIHCGKSQDTVHGKKCPLVKSIEYYPDGTIQKVTYFSPNDYAPMLTSIPYYQPINIPSVWSVPSPMGPFVVTSNLSNASSGGWANDRPDETFD